MKGAPTAGGFHRPSDGVVQVRARPKIRVAHLIHNRACLSGWRADAAGTVVASAEYTETAPLERVNPLPLASNLTFAIGLVRGATNDDLHVWQFTNSPGVVAVLSNLPPGSDYAFGRFNNELFPRFWSFVPGGTNGAFEYRRALPGPPQEFYRLRWP